MLKDIVSQEGVLEVDLHRGVVWFTPTEGKFKGCTTLRICGLPKGLNVCKDQQDVTVTDYIGKVHAEGKALRSLGYAEVAGGVAEVADSPDQDGLEQVGPTEGD